MILTRRSIFIVLFLLIPYVSILSQTERFELIPYGDMNSWQVREIKESFVIGGNTKYIHEIAKGDTIFENKAYKNTKSPWSMSSVLAQMKGVTKASVSVFPEVRGNGYAARLETLFDEVRVFGLINIKVLASGTIFLGEMLEPITNTSNPQSKLITGVPFTKRPVALQYDYKVITGGDCIKATGFGRQQKINQKDMAEVHLILQHRWEDSDGNVYAKRVATGWNQFGKTEKSWQNKHRMKIHYGDISNSNIYKPYMELRHGEKAYYTRNSKGKMVPINEESWAIANEEVTHIILQFSSSNGGAYIGNVESRLWIDNVGLLYDK